MDWILLIGVLLFGIGLIVLEIIFVPGTTFVGVIGFLIAGYGIYLAFSTFGNTTGFLTLFITGILFVGSLIYGFKTNAWDKFALKKVMEGKAHVEESIHLEVGQEGLSVSILKPMGKALFFDQEFEVTSQGNYISENLKIRIIQIQGKKIIVEPIT